MARLRVGLVLVDPEEIGFDTVQSVRVVEMADDYEDVSVYAHVLTRHRVPLVVTSIGPTLAMADFAHAVTYSLDYPTLPFLNAMRMLKKQKKKYYECLKGTIQCDVEDYVEDVIGLLRFALQRRGQDVIITFTVEQDDKDDQLKIYIPESDLERAWCSVHEASETNPYLGNRRYADIAWELCNLLSEIASTG